MSATTLTTLIGTALAVALGWYWGGATGTGIVTGFLAGASVAGLCALLQQRIARNHPRFAVQAVLGSFLLKTVAMALTTLLVRFVPALDAAVDARTYLFAFGAAVIGLTVPGTLDTLKHIGARGHARSDTARNQTSTSTST